MLERKQPGIESSEIETKVDDSGPALAGPVGGTAPRGFPFCDEPFTGVMSKAPFPVTFRIARNPAPMLTFGLRSGHG